MSNGFNGILDDEIQAMLPPEQYAAVQEFAAAGHMTVADVVEEIAFANGSVCVSQDSDVNRGLIAMALFRQRVTYNSTKGV